MKIALALFTLGLCATALHAQALVLERTIPLGDIRGRIDHFGYDAGGRRLFVAALGNDTVEVVDLKAGKVARSIRGLSEPQGICFVPEFNRLFVANGGDGAVRIYDGSTFAPVRTVGFDDDADNVRYDAQAKQLYVGYGDGGLGILDAASGNIVGRVAAPAHPESFQLDHRDGRIFVNVPGAHEIIVVDRAQRTVLAGWTPSAGSNFPMALDEADHRLIVGCRSPGRLLVLDTESGMEVAKLALHRDCDDVFYDGRRRQIYASCGEGYIDVFSQADPDHYSLKGAVLTAPKGRTCYFTGDHLYLALPRRGEEPAELRVYRPTER